MDFSYSLPTICEERIYEDEEEIHQRYFKMLDNGHSVLLADTTECEKQRNFNSSGLYTICEDENYEAEPGMQIEIKSDNGNKSSTSKMMGHSSAELDIQLSSFVREELDVIPEDKVYDDTMIKLRYFLSNEAGIPRKSTPDAVRKIQNDTLLRHWVNLCSENIHEKRSLEKELLGYKEDDGVCWQKFAEEKLSTLQEECVKLKNICEQMKSDLSSHGPEVSLSVDELSGHIREICRERMRCYRSSGMEEENIQRKENLFPQGNVERVDLPAVNQQNFVCMGSKKKLHDESEIRKAAEKNHAYASRKEQSQNGMGLLQEIEKIFRKPKVSDIISEKAHKESQSGLLSQGKDFALNDGCSHLQIHGSSGSSDSPPFFSHSVNGLHNGVKLPQIQSCLPMKSEVNHFLHQSKSVCKMPEIQTAKKQTRLETCSSASDPNQTTCKLPPIYGQAVYEKKTTTRTLASPKILPPLLSIPKSSKEIRKCFQVPKQKRPLMSIGKTNSYNILIIEHSDNNTPANQKKMSKEQLTSDRDEGHYKEKGLAYVEETATGTKEVKKKHNKNRIPSGRRHGLQ
ncbi:uncharacterized protein LOC134258630 [Saccostrea cucullata]|uniref:uncharacterized protein LOC134258630 n=1 Tax=Saccostrea cuccullata TaxID=36930 RepID=UPI002ED536EB